MERKEKKRERRRREERAKFMKNVSYKNIVVRWGERDFMTWRKKQKERVARSQEFVGSAVIKTHQNFLYVYL